jgi:arylsulfatase A-like enzyme
MVTIALLGATLWTISCARVERTPNIVLVVLDTVRRDALGGGATGSVTPSFDGIAARGTLFDSAWANSVWTIPTHASLFTGLMPSAHGCTSRNLVFDTPAPSIAELLADAGYETAAFFGNPLLHEKATGLLRGFAVQTPGFRLDEPIMRQGEQGGPRVVRAVNEWLDARDGSSPFFLFVNLLEPHLPYDPPIEYRRQALADLPLDDAVSVDWAHEFNAGLHDPDEVDWNRVRRLYSGDVHTADRLLGELIAMLETRGLLRDAVVIVTSDHGENLGEHDLVEHQFCIYETLLAVPLVVLAPDLLEPGTRHDPVMQTDFFATVVEAAGLDEVAIPSFSRSLFGPPFAQDRPVLAEYAGVTLSHLDALLETNPELDRRVMGAAFSTVRRGSMRWTIGSDGSRVLHDLATDPGQKTDVSERYPELVEELDRLLADLEGDRRHIENGVVDLSPQIEEHLRALGYLQ